MGADPADFYSLLKLSRNASAEEIRLAFLQLARELHPDLYTAKGDIEQFKLVRHAYEVLIDPIRRVQYDQTLAAQDHSGPPIPISPSRPRNAPPGSVPHRTETSRADDANRFFRRGQAAARVTSSVHRYWQYSGQANRRRDITMISLVLSLAVFANFVVDLASAFKRESRVTFKVVSKERGPQTAAPADHGKAGLSGPASPSGDATDRPQHEVPDDPHEQPQGHPTAPGTPSMAVDIIPSDPSELVVASPRGAPIPAHTPSVFDIEIDARERAEVKKFFEEVLPDLLAAIPSESIYADMNHVTGPGDGLQLPDAGNNSDPVVPSETDRVTTRTSHSASLMETRSRPVRRGTNDPFAASGLAALPGYGSEQPQRPRSRRLDSFFQEQWAKPTLSPRPHEAAAASVESSSIAPIFGGFDPFVRHASQPRNVPRLNTSPGQMFPGGWEQVAVKATGRAPVPHITSDRSAWTAEKEPPSAGIAWQPSTPADEGPGNGATTYRRLPEPRDYYRDAMPVPFRRPRSHIVPEGVGVPARAW